MITQLNITNVKETLREAVRLARHNIVLGGWGSGKTTIADALEVAIHGKPLSDLYTGAGNAVVFDALCTGGHDEMSVGLASDTLSFTRAYTRNASIKQDISIAGGPTGVQKCEPIIDEKLGRAIFDVRVLRDDPETVKRVLLSRCSFDGAAAYRQIVLACLRGLTDAFLGENWLEHYGEFNGFALESATPEQEQAMLEAARAKLNAAGVKEVDAVLPAPGSSWAYEGDLIGKLIESIAAAGEERKGAARDLQAAKKAVKAMSDDVMQRQPPTSSIQDVREMLRKHEEELSEQMRRKGAIEGRAQGATKLAREREQCAKRLDEIVVRELPRLEQMRTEQQAEEAHAKYTENDHEKALLLAEVAKTIWNMLELCIDCQAKVAGYREKKAALAQRIRKALDRRQQPSMSATEIASHRVRCEAEREMLQRRLAELEAAALEAAAVETVPQELTDIICGLQSAIAADRSALEELIAHKTRKEQYETQQLAVKAGEKRARVYDIVEGALNACYGDLVRSAMDPVVIAVTAALRTVAPDWDFYLELDGRGRLMFGVDKPVKGQPGTRCKTPYRALSGAESVFTRNVLGAILLKLNGSPEKILVDEIAELPVELVGDFLATMRQITGDQVQCLYMSCHMAVRRVIPEGWAVIERGQTTANVGCRRQEEAA